MSKPSVSSSQDLEAALLAEEQEIANTPEGNPADRELHVYEGFGSEGVVPTKFDGEDYDNLD